MVYPDQLAGPRLDNLAVIGDVSVITSLLGLWPGGDGVCPKLRLKGRRGRITAAYQLPATKRDLGGF